MKIQTEKINIKINTYIEFLTEKGEPNEAYKYLTIETFQKNWNIEATDFFQMFKASYKKIANLLYQNAYGYINTCSQYFPEETRKMFADLYDENTEISTRIKDYQKAAENLLPKIHQKLNRTNIKTQQDERTIAVYLTLKYPDKYTFYKADYYKELCQLLNIEQKKTGDRFIHYQTLIKQLIEEKIFENETLVNAYRKHYPQPAWDDKLLLVQNILYYSTTINKIGASNILDKLQPFDKSELEHYYNFLDEIIEQFNLNEGDTRLVFNIDENALLFTIGQRGIWQLSDKKSTKHTFAAIATNIFSQQYSNFEGLPSAYWNKTNLLDDIYHNKNQIFDAITQELNRSQTSSYSKYNKVDLERMAFDKDFRNEILAQLNYSTFEEKNMKSQDNNTQQAQNIILFGAPGTGKTYTLRNKYFPQYTILENNITTEKNFEEVVINLTWWQVIALALLENGVSSVSDILENKWIKKKAELSESKNVRATIWGNLQFHTINESTTVNYAQRQAPYIFDKTNDKTWKLDEFELREQAPEIYDIKNAVDTFKPNPNKVIKHYVFTTFHQSFSYEDFIEGIKPVLEENNGNISYHIENGIFKDLCLKAQNDPENRYAIFIDEINRGNVSAIFGELITLIEPDKRIGAANELTVKLPYSKREFGVPKNVDIIGTMNTADRSVEALDTALRRRFSFIEMPSRPEMLNSVAYKDVDLARMLEAINQRIEILIDKDHQIGHSYLISVKHLEDLKQVFKDKIIPLLEEYFYADFGKIGLVLGNNFIYQVEHKTSFPNNQWFENDLLEEKKIFRITDTDNWTVQTFISIYEDN